MHTAIHALAGPPHRSRRLVLKFLGTATIAGAAARHGVVAAARAAQQAAWPKEAFEQKSETAALQAFYDGRAPELSDKVTLDAPEIAENGAVVPVTISTTLPDVTSVAVLIPDNPFTLTAAYSLPAGTMADIACRLKMAKTAKVIAVVESGGKLYSAERMVKVTLGGCG